MKPDAYTFRMATPADIPEMAAQRSAMFRDVGHGTPAGLAEMETRFAEWVAPLMARGAWRQWFAERDGEPIGGAALWLVEPPPGPDGDPTVVPTVLNVYVAEAHRSRAVARRLMELIIETCRRESLGAAIDLRASEMGRSLYLSMGFEPTNELRLTL